MEIRLIVGRKNIILTLLSISCISLVLVLSGCGDNYSSSHGENDPSNTGSYACSLKWPEVVPTLETKSALPRAIDCDAAGIVTVEANFYDESGNYLTGDEWSCSLHEGTIYGIPAGTNRRLVVTGEDASGAMLYWGEETGITIVAGQTTQGGEIEMEYVYGTVPSTPTNVTATAGNEEVTISWDSATGATSYNIYWSTSQGVTKDTGTKISTFSSPYTHTVLTNETTYYYVVTAENSYGESSESDEVSATPSATGTAPSTPTNVTATSGNEEVTINWDTVTGATGYNIYWSTSQGVTKDTGTKISDFSSPYTHTGLTNGTTYYYVITAENSYGESGESDEVSATPSSTGSAPSAPTTVTATPGDGEVTISWDAASGATGYKIYMHTSSGVSKTNFTERRTVTATSYTWTGLTNGATYYYVITAENDYGESGESDEVSATPSAYTVVDTISVGDTLWGVTMTPDGSYVYVTGGGGTVSVIQTSDNTVVDTISVGDTPLGVAVTPDGSHVYVANKLSSTGTVSVIQTSDNTVIDTITLFGRPNYVAVTPNGSYVYVTDYANDRVSVIQTSDNTVVEYISVGDYPQGVVVTPDGSHVYVANDNNDTVSVIQTSDNTVIDTISVGDYPLGVAVTPNGSYVYVTNYSDDTVSVIQTSDNTVVGTISVGDQPVGVAVTPDGSYVCVTNVNNNTVSVIQTLGNTVVDTISVGDGPWGVAVTPDGSNVYVANVRSHTVSVIGFSD